MKQTPRLQAIQVNMQPGSLSAQGFLGDDSRNLADILSSDQSEVDRLKLSHQMIAAKMQELTDTGKAGLGKPVRLNNDYEIAVEDYMGKIPCPFQDSRMLDKCHTCAVNLKNGKQYCWTDLNIHMIKEHGFYEGKGSCFRIDPREIAEFLQLI